MKIRRRILRLALLVLVGAAVLWAGLNRDLFDPALLDGRLARLGIWAPAVHVGTYAVGTVAFVPGSVFALAGGALFGPVWGTLFNLLGATLGASVAFVVARYVAGDWAARKTDGGLKQVVEGVEAEGWRFVAFVRLVPVFPFNLTNYALGLTRIGFLPYVAASLACMVPGAIAFTWLGHAGREAMTGDASAIQYGLMSLGLPAAVAFLPRLATRVRTSRYLTWIEPEELLRKMAGGAKTTVLDVRDPDEFVGPLGHIAGAVNVPLSDLVDRLDELRRVSQGAITVVCRTDKRSTAAQATLRNADSKMSPFCAAACSVGTDLPLRSSATKPMRATSANPAVDGFTPHPRSIRHDDDPLVSGRRACRRSFLQSSVGRRGGDPRHAGIHGVFQL